MVQFHVDSEQVAAATAGTQASIGAIRAEVAGLTARLESLQGSWTGQAAAAFQGVVADWRSTQLRVEESLAAITDALGAAGRMYEDLELQTLRMFSGR